MKERCERKRELKEKITIIDRPKSYKRICEIVLQEQKYHFLNENSLILLAVLVDEIESGKYLKDLDGKIYCFLQNEELGRRIGVSRNTAQAYKLMLAKAGLISLITLNENQRNRTRIYLDDSLISDKKLHNLDPKFEDENGNILSVSFLQKLENIIEKNERENYKKLKTFKEKADFVFRTLIDSKNNINCYSLLCSQGNESCFYSHTIRNCKNIYYSFDSVNCISGQRLNRCQNLKAKDGEFIEYFIENKEMTEEQFKKLENIKED